MKNIITTVSLPQDMIEFLDEQADAQDLSRSQVVRAIIRKAQRSKGA